MILFFNKFTSALLFIFLCLTTVSQTTEKIDSIIWKPLKSYKLGEDPITNFSFQGVVYPQNSKSDLPYLILENENSSNTFSKPTIEAISTIPLSNEEIDVINTNKLSVPENFIISTYTGTMRLASFSFVHLFPVRMNSKTGSYEKLKQYKIQWIPTNTINKTSGVSKVFASNSVLATGNWYKFSIKNTGVYKIDKTFLQKLGVDAQSINTKNIRIYGNGGRILPEKNSTFRYDDLNEIAIEVEDGNDGVFNDNDYILFYGEGTEIWDYLPGSKELIFSPIKNYYSDSSYYFLNIDLGPGKRINSQASSLQAANQFVNSFDDYTKHEIDAVNLVKSGREKYGEYFDINTKYDFSFQFPFLADDTVRILNSVLGKNTNGTANFNISYPNGNTTLICNGTSTSYTANIGYEGTAFSKYVNSGKGSIDVSIEKTTPQATGWLNYILLNTRLKLSYNGSQLRYRDSRSVGKGNITKFMLDCQAQVNIWEVTDKFNTTEQAFTKNGTIAEYTLSTDSLREFIAFSKADLNTPVCIGKIENQDLHGLEPADYIIISHPLFLKEAKKLANLHAKEEQLSYIISTPNEIYNEFSSGRQDITALRDFVRMLYKKSAPNNLPKYLLLLGDGSYDNLNRDISTNTNFIPTYQTYNSSSFQPFESFTSDDFYSMMDDNEGLLSSTYLPDIGVGRIPVSKLNNAELVIQKIESYYKKDLNFNPGLLNTCNELNNSSFGDWRNWVCFVADDPDAGNGPVFMQNSDGFAQQVEQKNKNYNIDKIYADAFLQESTPGGERYPAVNDAINKRLEKGALILNYSGHGGELGLAAEAIVDVGQILNWKNINNMPLFSTATCEFSRYDDPARTSAGEYVLLNPNGGGIALFTTTRLAYQGDDDLLCPKLFSAALDHTAGNKRPCIGDIVRMTKYSYNYKLAHFTLLGDPAVTLAYPQYNVITSEINHKPVNSVIQDTISALQEVHIKGFIADDFGNKLTNYNGAIYPTVLDKTVNYSTLGNTDATDIRKFNLQKNIIYKGKSIVKNGDFEFSFMVPKDINYNYGKGRISYYAQDGKTDANGYYENFVIGGESKNIPPDASGPTIKLYMNNNKFVFGGTTNENPKIYVELTDSSGINTVGNGIGHDLIAILDNNSAKPILLNDYYQSDLNTYKSGKILYPLNQLSEGEHSLNIKVWDVQNNSGFAQTQFVVAGAAEIALKHVLNYPNPFTTSTKFYIEHNQCCTQLKLEIQVFSVSGKIVKTIQKNISGEGFRTEGIEWDGKDDYGDKIGRGVYIYRVSVTDGQQKKAEKFERLVILN